MAQALLVDVYYDYLCPYVYNAALWLERLKRELGPSLTLNWRYFSLEQVNSDQGPDWKLWEQADDYPSRGLLAFRAAEAARHQGLEAFELLHFALLRARHEQRKSIADRDVLQSLAKETGLNVAQFQKDLADRALLAKIGESHTYAVEHLGVFGTPTLVFPGEQAIFLKMLPPPPPEESVAVFQELSRLASQRPNIHEVKRPQKPQ